MFRSRGWNEEARGAVRIPRYSGRTEFRDSVSVPWAYDQSISHLITEGDLRELLAGLGLETVRWEDRTNESAAFLQTVLERFQSGGLPSLGLHLLMGEDFATKFANLLANLEGGCVQVVQAVVRKRG